MLALLPADLRGCAVLDAGCGSGRYLLHALRRNARRVLGVDLSAEMLARARGMGDGDWGLGVGASAIPHPQLPWLIQASLDAIPLRDRWADLTVCGLTIGHIERLDVALAELRRVTRPGGTILCSDFHPI